jgi:hypothetical protein
MRPRSWSRAEQQKKTKAGSSGSTMPRESGYRFEKTVEAELDHAWNSFANKCQQAGWIYSVSELQTRLEIDIQMKREILGLQSTCNNHPLSNAHVAYFELIPYGGLSRTRALHRRLCRFAPFDCIQCPNRSVFVPCALQLVVVCYWPRDR